MLVSLWRGVIIDMYLRDAAAERDALEELVEGERGEQRAHGAGAHRGPEGDTDEHRVGDDAGLEHLEEC
jgi:hypothetical protein